MVWCGTVWHSVARCGTVVWCGVVWVCSSPAHHALMLEAFKFPASASSALCERVQRTRTLRAHPALSARASDSASASDSAHIRLCECVRLCERNRLVCECVRLCECAQAQIAPVSLSSSICGGTQARSALPPCLQQLCVPMSSCHRRHRRRSGAH